MHIRSFRATAAAGGAALALALTGCGGGGADISLLSDLTAAQVLERAGEASAAQKSGSFTVEITGTGDLAISLKGEGRYTAEPDYATEMSFSDFSAAGQSIPGGMEMRQIGDVLYLRMPGLGELAGFEWLKMDLGELGDMAGFDLGELAKQQQLSDPRAQLQILLSSGDIAPVGEEEVDGVTTMHYAGTVDPGQIATQQGFDAEIQEALQSAYTQLGVSEIAYDLWVDGDFQVRKMTIEMPTGSGGMTISMAMGDFGSTVTVEAPDNATDFSELLGSL